VYKKFLFLFIFIFIIKNSFIFCYLDFFNKIGIGFGYNSNPLYEVSDNLIINQSFSKLFFGKFFTSTFLKIGEPNFKFFLLLDTYGISSSLFSNNNLILKNQLGFFYYPFDENLIKLFLEINYSLNLFINGNINLDYKYDIFDFITLKIICNYNLSEGFYNYIEYNTKNFFAKIGFNFDINDEITSEINFIKNNDFYISITNLNNILNNNAYSFEFILTYNPLFNLEMQTYYKISFNNFNSTNLIIINSTNNIYLYNTSLVNSCGFQINYDWNLSFSSSLNIDFEYYNILSYNYLNLYLNLIQEITISTDFKIRFPLSYNYKNILNYSINQLTFEITFLYMI